MHAASVQMADFDDGALRREQSLLIDCGEGTQVALREKGWSPKPIDFICFTHYHADHISGLPGLASDHGQCRTHGAGSSWWGRRGWRRSWARLSDLIAPELPFPIVISGAYGSEGAASAGTVSLWTPTGSITASLCYGYAISIPRTGRFDAERAQALGHSAEVVESAAEGTDRDG
jgi:ribonuclease Z